MSCNNCQAIAINSCGACGTVKYCSKRCQSEDWTSHKTLCPQLPLSMRSIRWSLGLNTDEMTFLFERYYSETAVTGLEAFIQSRFKREVKVDSELFFRLWKHALTEKYGKSTLIMNVKSSLLEKEDTITTHNNILTIKTASEVKSNFYKLTLKKNYLRRKLIEVNVPFDVYLMKHENGFVFLSVIGPMVASLEDIIRLEAMHIDVRLKYEGLNMVDSFLDDLKLNHKWTLKSVSI